MSLSINPDLLANGIGNLTAEEVQLIEKRGIDDTERLARFEKLEGYFKGEHKIKNRKPLNEKSRVELGEIITNSALYITRMNVGFAFGNPVSYVAVPKVKENYAESTRTKLANKAKSKLRPVLTAYEGMNIHAHDQKMGKDLSTLGEAYELLYHSKILKRLRIKKINPRNCILVTDDSVDEYPLFGLIRTKVSDLNGAVIGKRLFVYWRNGVIQEFYFEGNECKKEIRKRHVFRGVPLIRYKNNEEGMGDFEPVIALIDARNEVQSDRLTDKRSFIRALLVVYGAKLPKDGESDIKDGVLYLPALANGVKAEYLTKAFEEQSIQTMVDSYERDLHKIAMTPNLADINKTGAESGNAMAYELFTLLQLLATKQRYYIEGLGVRLQLMQNYLNFKSPEEPVDVEGVKIHIKPNLPVNLTEVINQINLSQNFLPLAISLGWMPDIDDPEAVMEMHKEETKERLTLQNEVLTQSLGDNPQAGGKVYDKTRKLFLPEEPGGKPPNQKTMKTKEDDSL